MKIVPEITSTSLIDGKDRAKINYFGDLSEKFLQFLDHFVEVLIPPPEVQNMDIEDFFEQIFSNIISVFGNVFLVL